MQYDKTIKDTEGDTARVAADPIDHTVELWTRQEIGPGSVYLALEPNAARRLARALKRAANVAEGKPAKTPKLRAVPIHRDADGDYWFLNPDGRYSIDRPGGRAIRDLDSVREAYGTWGGERP